MTIIYIQNVWLMFNQRELLASICDFYYLFNAKI